ncbi:MAG: HK97 family phage prohead protease [Pseudomonadota bacterium]
MLYEHGLEQKFCRFDDTLSVKDGTVIEGYASLFGDADRGGDIVEPGAYASSLGKLKAQGNQVKMLWQHDPSQPIGVWDEVREDDKGLYVKGRLLAEVERAREAVALIAEGAIDGLSIGYRTLKASKNEKGQRLLKELELWEVSLVTFPMLPSARVGAKGDTLASDDLRELALAFEGARQEMARM